MQHGWSTAALSSVLVVCRCVYQHPDPTGKIGVELNRDLVKVAGKALTHNLTKLGPKVLPWSEKLLYAANWVGRKALPGKWKEYVPDFKEAFDHFCLHAGKAPSAALGLSSQGGLRFDLLPMAGACKASYAGRFDSARAGFFLSSGPDSQSCSCMCSASIDLKPVPVSSASSCLDAFVQYNRGQTQMKSSRYTYCQVNKA